MSALIFQLSGSSVPPGLRSRLLATRFFGGGILTLGVIAIAERLAGTYEFPMSYAAIIAMASIFLFISSVVFTALGEPETKIEKPEKPPFIHCLKNDIKIFQTDENSVILPCQCCGDAILMAMPFYIVQADASGINLLDVALLLAAQTTGALVSNPL